MTATRLNFWLGDIDPQSVLDRGDYVEMVRVKTMIDDTLQLLEEHDDIFNQVDIEKEETQQLQAFAKMFEGKIRLLIH